MVQKICRLTDAQIARFEEFKDMWIQIGLSAEPADRINAEKNVNLAYKAANLRPPEKIIWCDSPLSQVIVVGVLRELNVAVATHDLVNRYVRNSVSDYVRDSVMNSVMNSASDSVRNSVSSSVWPSVRYSVSDPVRNSVWNSVRNSVSNSVRNSVWNFVSDSVRSSINDFIWDWIYGSHEAGWLAFYDYFRCVVGLSAQTNVLIGLTGTAKCAGWWLPFSSICFISERHNVLKRNLNGQLHCEDGPAVMYPDGWKIWAIDGILLQEQIVMRPESQTIQQINEEKNADIKNIRITRFGWLRYLKESEATLRHEAKNYVTGCPEALYVTKDGDQRLVVVCPTGRVFCMGVPREIETCEAAQRWLAPQNISIIAAT